MTSPSIKSPPHMTRKQARQLAAQRQGVLDDVMDAARTVMAEQLADLTVGFSGADASNLCNLAALYAASHGAASVSMDDFNAALDRHLGGLERSRSIADVDRHRTAVHEAGHAVVAWFSARMNPPIKVSIVWRGEALGYTQFRILERTGQTIEDIFDTIKSVLGGRAAEQIMFGTPSGGAVSDLEKVTAMAYEAIGRLGFNKDLGLLAVAGNSKHRLSEETCAMYDSEARGLVTRAYDDALALIKAKEKAVRVLVAELEEKNVIYEADLQRILGPRHADALAIEAAYSPEGRRIVPAQEKKQTGV